MHTHTAAHPWDILLRAAPMRLQCDDTPATEAAPGTKLASLLQVLAERGSATTSTLAVCADLDTRQVWGLLKAPRAIGQVQFEAGRWSLNADFAGRDVARAEALLRARSRAVLHWQPASILPDADTTVLCWLVDGDWFSGWWDGAVWRDAAHGGPLDGVTHWAEPEGPEA